MSRAARSVLYFLLAIVVFSLLYGVFGNWHYGFEPIFVAVASLGLLLLFAQIEMDSGRKTRLFLSIALLLLIFGGYLVFEEINLLHSGHTYNWIIPFFVVSSPFAAAKVGRLINPLMLIDFIAWVFWAVSYVRGDR